QGFGGVGSCYSFPALAFPRCAIADFGNATASRRIWRQRLRPPAAASQAAWTQGYAGGVMVSQACRFRADPRDVTEWLHGLGLEQYGPAFRDHDIDREVLRRLTGEDLRELGVASIGHRRRLLDAIAALTDAQPVPNAPVASVPAVGAAAIAE